MNVPRSTDNRENALTAEALAGLNPEQRKARLGQALLLLVQTHQPILAVHVMKALLEPEDDEVLALLENASHGRSRNVTEDLARQDEPKSRTELRRSTDG